MKGGNHSTPKVNPRIQTDLALTVLVSKLFGLDLTFTRIGLARIGHEASLFLLFFLGGSKHLFRYVKKNRARCNCHRTRCKNLQGQYASYHAHV